MAEAAIASETQTKSGEPKNVFHRDGPIYANADSNDVWKNP